MGIFGLGALTIAIGTAAGVLFAKMMNRFLKESINPLSGAAGVSAAPDSARVVQMVGPDANLQTSARGVNVVGLESQTSDIIRLHAKLFKKHGITTIRNFDALNDVENLIYSGRCIVEEGLLHQVVVTLMELPPGCSGAHDPDFYEATLRKILDAEISLDAVCFKDASGTSVPATVYETM